MKVLDFGISKVSNDRDVKITDAYAVMGTALYMSPEQVKASHAVDGRTVVFIEVKTRTTHDAGHPADAVDEAKQRRLTRLALSYMKRHDLWECQHRFDVVAVTWPDRGRPTIEHYPSAFEAIGFDGHYS